MSAEMNVSFPWLKPSEISEEVPKKDRLPIPIFEASGKKVVCYQEPADERRGLIIIPPDARKKLQATVGTVISLGDGYDPDTSPDEWLGWQETCPYQAGTKVVWSRYQDMSVKLPVEDDWWDSAEEKQREDGKVEFILLHVKDIIGVVR